MRQTFRSFPRSRIHSASGYSNYLFGRLDVDRQRFRATDDDFITLLNFVEALHIFIYLQSNGLLLWPAQSDGARLVINILDHGGHFGGLPRDNSPVVFGPS